MSLLIFSQSCGAPRLREISFLFAAAFYVPPDRCLLPRDSRLFLQFQRPTNIFTGYNNVPHEYNVKAKRYGARQIGQTC